MLIDAKQSALLVVDVQGKLVPAISGWQALLDHVVWLIRVARRMDVPVLACEQYPQGLGPTHPLIAAELPAGCVAGKLHFSAVAGGCHGFAAAGSHPQLVVCGMETHVCVFQTVRELAARGLHVLVPLDGVASRRDDHRAAGLDLCRAAGATITTSETLVFDWLRRAGTEQFKRISKLVR